MKGRKEGGKEGRKDREAGNGAGGMKVKRKQR